MDRISEWYGDTRQRVMTHLVNRTCKRHPNWLDRRATDLLTRIIGAPAHDPELDHPEAESQ